MTGFPDVSGLVVAGGASARLGMDKRDVRLGGASLLERAAALLAAVSDDVMIAGPPLAGGNVRLVRDPVPGRGPMAGILAGLQHARHARLLVIPVDMPLLTGPLLRFLVLRDVGAAITVPRWRAGMEPLVGVYHCACAGDLVDHVTRGTTALHAFIGATTLAVRFVEEPELRAYGEPERLFLNVNTPEDLTRAEWLLREPPPPPAQP
jgi:molybdopterin-guanine dinucleotide biosynthesis protein A